MCVCRKNDSKWQANTELRGNVCVHHKLPLNELTFQKPLLLVYGDVGADAQHQRCSFLGDTKASTPCVERKYYFNFHFILSTCIL